MPDFPTTLSSIEAISILNSVVMKKIYAVSATPEKRSPFRPSTAGSISAFGSPKIKPIWVSHQLILTSIKINESTPQHSPDLNEFSADPHPVGGENRTQTFAHLHLFALPPAQTRTPPRPSTGGMPGSGFRRRPVTAQGLMSEAAASVEVERRALGPKSTAGVYEDDSGMAKRRNVLQIAFGRGKSDEQMWLCDMPNASVESTGGGLALT